MSIRALARVMPGRYTALLASAAALAALWCGLGPAVFIVNSATAVNTARAVGPLTAQAAARRTGTGAAALAHMAINSLLAALTVLFPLAEASSSDHGALMGTAMAALTVVLPFAAVLNAVAAALMAFPVLKSLEMQIILPIGPAGPLYNEGDPNVDIDWCIRTRQCSAEQITARNTATLQRLQEWTTERKS